MAERHINIFLASSGGADLLPSRIENAFSDLTLKATVTYGGYSQWQQNLLAGANETADISLILLEGEDLFAPLMDELLEADSEDLERLARTFVSHRQQEVRSATNAALDAGHGFVAVTSCIPPAAGELGALSAHRFGVLREAVTLFNRTLLDLRNSSPRLLILDLEDLYFEHGRQQLHDPRLFNLARCRFSRTGLDHIAQELTRLWMAATGQTHKCLVLDLDGTLWGGVLGEDGQNGIQITHEGPGLAFRLFQKKLEHLASSGTLLAIASKNDESIVWKAFAEVDAMVLRKDSFASWRINWHDKAENLRSMASELNLGLDAFVFVDNNPAERERVRSALPEVTIADWPDDPAFLPQFAQDLGARYFNRLTLSVEDQTKTQQYRSQVERRRLSSSCTTLEDYLQALEMRAHLFLADPGDAPRLSQLTQKTNQFNATTRRYTVGEMESRISARDWIVLGASLSDRFGDSGIVGLAMATVHPENGVWLIDNFLLSCRVVGRTLEKSLLDSLSKRVRELGGTSMVAHYLPTQRNSLVEHLWRDLNFEWLAEKDHWHWDLDREALPSPYITTVLTSR